MTKTDWNSSASSLRAAATASGLGGCMMVDDGSGKNPVSLSPEHPVRMAFCARAQSTSRSSESHRHALANPWVTQASVGGTVNDYPEVEVFSSGESNYFTLPRYCISIMRRLHFSGTPAADSIIVASTGAFVAVNKSDQLLASDQLLRAAPRAAASLTSPQARYFATIVSGELVPLLM